MYKVEKYSYKYYDLWNGFVKQSKNATFLFHRDFMEYHSDRFEDFSVLIFEDDALKSILPANRVEDTLYSHQGLTYGGIYTRLGISKEEVKLILERLVCYLKLKGLKQLIFKKLPAFYVNEKEFSWRLLEEDFGLKQINQQKCLAIDYADNKIHKTKLKHYRKAVKLGLRIEKTYDFSVFWKEVLTPRLETKHKVKPVHNLHEISYLSEKFPENIIQFNAYFNEKLLAGITIFDKGKVVKSQYGATTDLGEKYYAMDFLFVHLIEYYQKIGKKYFSMGTVTENNELGYNKGLLRQKIELGCKEFPFTYFQIDIND